MLGLETSLLDQMDSNLPANGELERDTLLEIHRSFFLNTESPYPNGFDIAASPYHAVRDLFPSPFIHGKTPAKTSASLFQSWESNGDIPTLDLSVGPPSLSPTQAELDSGDCTYLKPKTGNGTRPGFKISCNGKTVKVKFMETHSHPFAARILWALGYFVAPANYAPHMTLPYDRKIFTEINSRAGVNDEIHFGKLNLFNFHYNPVVNMITYIDHATLKTGQILTPTELAPMIGNATAEATLATITTRELQTQVDDPQVLQIGTWSFNDFDHPDDRGIRALALPLAWMAGWDFRQGNNSLAVDLSGSSPKYEFFLPDLGGVLGSARSFYLVFDTIENEKGLDHPIAKHGELARYTTIEKNEAFKDCTREDAQWMLSRLNQLSSDQIKAALESAGYNGVELDQFLQILLKRRNELTEAFQ